MKCILCVILFFTLSSFSRESSALKHSQDAKGARNSNQDEFTLDYFKKKYGSVILLNSRWCPNDSVGELEFVFKHFNPVVQDTLFVSVYFKSNGHYAGSTSECRSEAYWKHYYEYINNPFEEQKDRCEAK